MKKNLIFKLCFIVGIFLIILSACDLGTNNKIKRANITFNLEGPAIEQARANSKASSSSRYIHPNASSLKFELFSGKELLDSQTISINKEKNISITIQDVPLNDPNLRAEIEVWGTKPEDTGPSILGQNTIHLGRIGLGYTKLTLGVKPVGNDLETATYEDEDGDIFLNVTGYEGFTVLEIKMLSQKGLYTIEVDSLDDLVLYASDGRQYKNTHPIQTGEMDKTLVFYHPKDEASTYYLASSPGNSIYNMSGTKLEQDILITQKSDESSSILANPGKVYFEEISSDDSPKTHSFTIYNPYSYALSFTTKFKNETVTPITGGEPFESKNNFKTNSFPHSLPPGKSQKFEIIFEPEKNGNFSADFTIQAAGLDDFVLNLVGSNYSD